LPAIPKRKDTGIPWRLPVVVVSGVLISACYD
jgi:hypothetical protein